MRLSKEERGIIQYIRHYPEWMATVQTMADARQAIRYDLDKVQTASNADQTYELAMQISECEQKILKVEHALWDTFRVNTRVDMMRDVFCYGQKSELRDGTFYRWRKKFAKRLLEEEW